MEMGPERHHTALSTPRHVSAHRRLARRGVVLAGAAGGSALLSACAAGAGAPGAGKGTTASLKDQKLTFLHWWTGALGPGFEPMMDWAANTFRERTGAQVEYATGKTGGGLNEKFLTMTTAGTPPDASFMSVVIGRDDYDAGMLKNLSPYIAKSADLADKEFFESARKFRQKGNETFGIPVMGPESLGFIVNSGLFSAVGLDPKGADLKTWDDLARAGQKLTKASGDDFQQSGLLVNPLNLAWLSAWLYSNSNGTSLTNAEETKYLIDVPAVREAVQFSADLIQKQRVSPKLDGSRPTNARQALIAGQVAMIYDESAIGLLNAPPDFKFWFVPLPKGPRGTGLASSTWTNILSMAKDAKNPDAALEWIRFFTGIEFAVQRLRFVKAAHPRVKFYDTPEWKEAVRNDPILGFIPEAAKLPGPYPYLRYNRIDAETSPIFRSVLLGQLGVNEGLAEAQKKADQIMSEPVRVQ
jgi:multiple sugar transport system substrate-binding protein